MKSSLLVALALGLVVDCTAFVVPGGVARNGHGLGARVCKQGALRSCSMRLTGQENIPASSTLYRPVIQYKSIEVETIEGPLNDYIAALIVNEFESRLVDDVRQFLIKLAPPGQPYLHNDLHLRPLTEEDKRRVVNNGWDISDPATLKAWRAQEPFNAHSHLLAMLLGSSESIPVADGKLVIGQWQSVMLVDLDGPRKRTVGIQVVGL